MAGFAQVQPTLTCAGHGLVSAGSREGENTFYPLLSCLFPGQVLKEMLKLHVFEGVLG